MRVSAVAACLVVAGCLDSPPGEVRVDAGGGGVSDGAVGGGDDAGGGGGGDGGCPAGAGFPGFSADFESGGLPSWAMEMHSGAGADAVVRVVGGTLSFEPVQAAPEAAWVRTVDRYDFTDLRAAVRVVEVLAEQSPSPTMFFRLEDGSGGQESMFLSEDSMHAGGTVVAYNAVAHAWWQIRSEGATIYFETSPDGVLWSELSTFTPTTFDFGDVVVDVGIGIDQDLPDAAGRFRVDDVNLPPDRCQE